MTENRFYGEFGGYGEAEISPTLVSQIILCSFQEPYNLYPAFFVQSQH